MLTKTVHTEGHPGIRTETYTQPATTEIQTRTNINKRQHVDTHKVIHGQITSGQKCLHIQRTTIDKSHASQMVGNCTNI